MVKIIDAVVRLIEAGKRAYARKWIFLAVFACIYVGSVLTLGAFDLLPENPFTVNAEGAPLSAVQAIADRSAPINTPELPVKMEIAAISLAANVVNPTTTDIAALDRELLKGAVRYPTSAKLGETGNVVLFGHSSYLPVVGNQAYKTFNSIQKLKKGDLIIVYSSGTAYVYSVKNVAMERADENSAIPLITEGRVLTLVTCNSFGTKADRFIVTADFVESRPAPLL